VGLKSFVRKKMPAVWLGYRSLIFTGHAIAGTLEWIGGGYPVPAPTIVKRAVIKRNALPGGTFVETGTYMGDTTSFARRFSSRVISYEPDRRLFELAALRFKGVSDVTLLNAASDEALQELLPTLSGAVTFWLDAHYSGVGTHMGRQISPIEMELAAIGAHLNTIASCVIMVDDVRGFGVSPGYPPLIDVARWAEANAMTWHIEHDILVMRSRN